MLGQVNISKRTLEAVIAVLVPEDNISCSYHEPVLLFPENRGQQTFEVAK